MIGKVATLIDTIICDHCVLEVFLFSFYNNNLKKKLIGMNYYIYNDNSNKIYNLKHSKTINILTNRKRNGNTDISF